MWARDGLILSLLWLLPASSAWCAEPGPSGVAGRRGAPATPPNILLVLIDDWGHDRWGVTGEGTVWPATPNLDVLAATSLRFVNFYSCPLCSPTRAALLTGRRPAATGVGWTVEDTDPKGLPLSFVTVAERLRAAGYTTGLIGKWHVSGATGYWPLDPVLQGFDFFAGSRGNLTDYSAWVRDVAIDGGGTSSSVETRYSTDAITQDAVTAMSVMEAPWFLWVAYHAVHEPWASPPGMADPGTDLGRYLQMVTYLDDQLGTLLNLVPEDTIVLVLADNGTPNAVADYPGGSGACPYPCGSKKWLSEPGVNVPLMVKGPGVSTGVTTALAQSEDLAVTICALAGAEALPSADGLDLSSVLADPCAAGPRSYVLLERFRPNADVDPSLDKYRRCVRDGRYKLVRRPGVPELFHDLSATTGPDDGPNLCPCPLSVPAEYATLAAVLTAWQAK